MEHINQTVFFMKRKKKVKGKKRGQSSWLKAKNKKSRVSASNTVKGVEVAGTTTGEVFQPMRLHYDILNHDDFITKLAKLRCIDFDPPGKRWVWLYIEEAKALKLARGIKEVAGPVVLGELLPKKNGAILNVRSFERGRQAVEFFDKYIPRDALKLTHVTICNKLFTVKEVSTIKSLHQYFEQTETLVRRPEKLTEDIMELTAGIDDQEERMEAVSQLLDKRDKEPLPELEQFPVYFYEEGIDQLKMQLNISQIVAYEHWQGNTGYTTMDAIHTLMSEAPLADK
ncbi:MAG: hypothetical protein D3919_00260 [Candidatus Electrothrix sp. AW5]|nr:hypothetical protein [Candidatus Electrothrix gigas]